MDTNGVSDDVATTSDGTADWLPSSTGHLTLHVGSAGHRAGLGYPVAVSEGSGTQPHSVSKQTRRSTADVNDAVFEAVREELAEVGYRPLTMAGVARRAGTSRRALYMRWSTKDQMIYDSIVPYVPTAVSFVSSGDLRTDLIEFLPRVTAFKGTIGRAARSIVAESYRDPDSLTELREHLMSASWSGLRQLLLEAIARGEADTAALDPEVIMVISAVVFHQLCLSSEPMREDVVVRIVDRILLSLVQSDSYAAAGVARAG